MFVQRLGWRRRLLGTAGASVRLCKFGGGRFPADIHTRGDYLRPRPETNPPPSFSAPPLNIIITFIYWGCLFEAPLRRAARETIKMSEQEKGLVFWVSQAARGSTPPWLG